MSVDFRLAQVFPVNGTCVPGLYIETSLVVKTLLEWVSSRPLKLN